MRLHCLELGLPRSEIVVLVHGFSQNRVAFLEGVLPRTLEELGFGVVIAELRGHGSSERPSSPWSIRDHLALDLPSLFEAYAGSRVHYVGHSMGGLLGYASLSTNAGWASVTGLAAPLRLGAGSPLVRPAAWTARRMTWALQSVPVPMDRFLSALSEPLGRRAAGPGMRVLQRILGLSNPALSPPGSVQAVLRASDQESMPVFREFLRFAMPGGREMAGVHLERAIRSAPVPVAAVVGDGDIFAPPASVAPLLNRGQAGPRRVISLPGAAHVDLTVGRDVASAVAHLTSFWEVGRGAGEVT